MFRRSSRVSTKPETVQMLQENEAKKKSVAKKRAPPSQKIRQLQGKIQKPKPVKTPGIKLFNVLNSLNNKQTLYSIVLTNVQKKQKRKKKLESQFILPYIKKIIDVSPNSPKYIKDGLIYLYSNHFGNDQIIKRSKESLNDIKIRIKKQLDVLEKNSVTANEKISVELSANQEIDLLFLIWCDMIHDQNISVTSDNISFSKFINSDIANKLFGNRERTFKYTNYIKNLLGILRKNPKGERGQQEFFFTNIPENNTKNIKKGTTKTSGWSTGWWEKIWKREIIQTVSYNSNQNGANYEKNTVILRPGEVKAELFKRQILVSIDQEPNTSKNVSSALFRSKNENTRVKQLQPTISIANLIDPGVDMVKNSINANKAFLDASNTITNQIRSKVRWNLTPYEFKLGNMNIKTELVQKPINKGGFKYTYDYVINNEKYKSNVAKGTGNKTADSISKFTGDFYQILTALRMQKENKLYVPASGDGMFCVIYAYLAKHVYKTTPRMIFIKDRGGTEPTNLVFLNLKEYMNNPNTRNNSTRVFTEKRKLSSISSSISGSNSNNEVTSNASNARNEANRLAKAKAIANQNAKNEANRLAKAKAIANQKANKKPFFPFPVRKKQKQVNNSVKKLNEKFGKLGNMKMNISKVNQTPKSGARITTPKNPVFNLKINRTTNNNKLTPKKTKTNNRANNMNVNNGANIMNINARTELNKLTSLRPNQKNNYLKKINETPNNILNILYNARRVANSQRPPR
jgi:hypothetical protein